ncbi:metallophosphoesterase family protein [Chitinimonas sp.]|uniref:metallophosphoesterase family protein n=1 Tax=Chitinimonas sp. TaxID=1934313 RepID=UPI002F9253C0
MQRIGLISDTHGLLRPEALAALRGCDHLIHAGDIGKPEILTELARLAPLTAVRGNNDTAPWVAELPEQTWLELDGVRIYVLHDLAELTPDGPAGAARVVVSGHSHRPQVVLRDGLLLVNPGSAGPRRFKLPVSVGELWLAAGGVSAHIRPLLLA